jgi:hypothetical protein
VYAAEYCEFKGFAMRILLLALLLASASVPYAFAQTKPEESRPLAASNPGPSTKPTPWQILDWSTYVKKCAAHYHSVSLTVTIGPDGLITGSPKIESPIDNDEFRDDVETVVKTLHSCEPFDVESYGLGKRPFAQPFYFSPRTMDEEVFAAVKAHFKKCYARPATGPDVKVELRYKNDGTFEEPPRPLNPESTTEYSNVAASVIDQLGKCPSLEFPSGKYAQVHGFTWTFSTVESDAAFKLKALTSYRPPVGSGTQTLERTRPRPFLMRHYDFAR